MTTASVALVWIAVLAIQGVTRWRERGVSSLVSCLLIMAAFPLALISGGFLRDAIFSYNLDRWDEAVTWVTANNHPNENRSIKLPRQYANLAYGVHYKQSEECGLVIDFFWGGGFPVKHTVRRYAVNPEWMDVEECRSGWSRGRALSGNWYEIAD